MGHDNLEMRFGSIGSCSAQALSTMSFTHRILARASAGRRAAVPSLTRSYAARYPFTPDSSVTPQANEAATKHPLSPYPFTKPGQPTPQQSNQASPIGPVPTSARPGPEMKDSELRQADEGDRSQQDMNPRQPDYNVASDYRTSYVGKTCRHCGAEAYEQLDLSHLFP